MECIRATHTSNKMIGTASLTRNFKATKSNLTSKMKNSMRQKKDTRITMKKRTKKLRIN